MRYEIGVQTDSRVGFVDITSRVQDCVRKSGVQDGVCVVFAPHTTAAITCNENSDACVQADLLMALDRIVPANLGETPGPGYTHEEGNSPAHVKASLLGSSQSLLVTGRKLDLGRWQGVFLAEFDGPRQRRVWITVLRDAF
jgi:secondary thiamine-phosphate synthase enzyme